METREVMHDASTIMERPHVDAKKLSALVSEVFSKNRDLFRASKLEIVFKLDKRLKDEVESACRLSGVLDNQNLEVEDLIACLQNEYGYCEPCAEVALEYFVGKV